MSDPLSVAGLPAPAKPRASPKPDILTKARTLPLNEVAKILAPLSPEAFLHLFITLSAIDAERLSQLLSRKDVTYLLDTRSRDLGEHPQSRMFADAGESLAAIAAAAIANLRGTGATYRHSYITARLSRLVPKECRFDCFYRNLLDVLSGEPQASRIKRKGGLYYIYINAATSAFEAREPDRAFDLCAAARELADLLPDNELSAKARFAGLIKFASYLAHLDTSKFRLLEADAHADLDRELRNVLRFDPVDGRLLRLQAALTRSNLWRSADAKKLCGPITSAEARISLLGGALTDAYGVSVVDGVLDAVQLTAGSAISPPAERKAIGRVLVDIAQAYARTGDDVRGSWFVAESHKYDLSSRSRLDADIAMARVTTDVGVTVRLCEKFVREHVSGDLKHLTTHHHERALRQYSSIAYRLSNLLKANKDYSSAAFWRLQAGHWRIESENKESRWTGSPDQCGEYGSPGDWTVRSYVEHVLTPRRQPADLQPEQADSGARQRERQRLRSRKRRSGESREEGSPIFAGQYVEQTDGIGFVTGPSEESTTSVGPASDLVEQHNIFVRESLIGRLREISRHISNEDANTIITILFSVGQSPNLVIDKDLGREIRAAITTVAAWRPEYCGDLASLLPALGVEGPDIVIPALRAAAALARPYAPYRLAPLLLNIGMRPELSSAERLALIDEAFAVARSQGRSILELRSFHKRLRLTDEQGTPVDEGSLADELAGILHRSNESTAFLGMSGVFDRAIGLAAELADLAETLAESGRPELAFRVSGMAQGRTADALAQNPGSSTELTDSLTVRRSGEKANLHRFYATVITRICAPSEASVRLSVPARKLLEDENQDGAAVVRLIGPSSNRVWALGKAADTTYFAIQLDATALELSDLAGAVWFLLRASREQERDAILRSLYERCVAPVWPRVAGATRVTFAFHDRIPFLPLHGALGPDGFVGVTIPIGYEFPSAVAYDWDRRGGSLDAAILGWEPSTGSDQEALDVSKVVDGRFALVSGSSPQSTVANVILNPERELAILHVAGHGHLLRFPHAMDSSFELLPGVAVKALDLLQSGCRSRFVFLNVCGLGNSEVTAGDAYGFALALRSRGTQALLAPATYIAPNDAKVFALHFYAAAMDNCLMEAVRITVSKLVALGSPPSAWIPYALSGDLPALSSWS